MPVFHDIPLDLLISSGCTAREEKPPVRATCWPIFSLVSVMQIATNRIRLDTESHFDLWFDLWEKKMGQVKFPKVSKCFEVRQAVRL